MLNAFLPQAEAALRKQRARTDKLRAQYDALNTKDSEYAEVTKQLMLLHESAERAMITYIESIKAVIRELQ